MVKSFNLKIHLHIYILLEVPISTQTAEDPTVGEEQDNREEMEEGITMATKEDLVVLRTIVTMRTSNLTGNKTAPERFKIRPEQF